MPSAQPTLLRLFLLLLCSTVTAQGPTTINTTPPTTTLVTTTSAASAGDTTSFLLDPSSLKPIPTTLVDDIPDNPNLHSNGNDSDDSDTRKNQFLINYYYVFLGLFFGLLCCGIWAIHRRRKVRKALARLDASDALARDVHGWAPGGGYGRTGAGRRWVRGGSGGWRFDAFGGGRGRANTDQEGLNELGEAPPPYKGRGDGAGSTAIPPPPAQATDTADMPAVPLRTLSRPGAKPPGYEETMRLSALPDGATMMTGGGQTEPVQAQESLERGDHGRNDSTFGGSTGETSSQFLQRPPQ